MVEVATFLTILDVMVDDFCKTRLPAEAPRPGPSAALSRSEIVTLALFGQWQAFGSERGFYRYAERHWRGAFPGLPARAQFNRLVRRHHGVLVACFLHWVRLLHGQACAYEALDTLAVPTRDAKRRGQGWLPALADLGWSNRWGWYEGFHLLLAANPRGVITGFGVGSGSTKDQPLAETFFAVRGAPQPALPSVGAAAQGPYLTDTGFEGQARHQHWQQDYGAVVICAPKRNSSQPWSQYGRRWLAGLRQIVETVNGTLLHVFRWDRERPHALEGFQARLAAKMALHNFCIWLNQQLGRPPLAFADLLAW